MGDPKPNLALIPGGVETRQEQKRRHAAGIAALRSEHRWAMSRIVGFALCAAGLMIGGTYVAAEFNALVGMLIVLAFVAPVRAMDLDVELLATQRELRVLRRIARRVGSGHEVPDGDGRWHRVTGLVADGEPMTPGEFAAVYGAKETNDG